MSAPLAVRSCELWPIIAPSPAPAALPSSAPVPAFDSQPAKAPQDSITSESRADFMADMENSLANSLRWHLLPLLDQFRRPGVRSCKGQAIGIPRGRGITGES